MIGFKFPIEKAYSAKLDNQKAWSRELMLRILKIHSPM